MASNTFTRHTITGDTQHTRKGTQGRRKKRDYVTILLRVPVEHHELMVWNNEISGGNNSVTAQIQSAIRAALCGCVYTQLFKQ